MSAFSTFYLVALLVINVFGATNAGILAAFLHKSRHMADAVLALYTMMVAKFIVAASLALIVAEALIWPAVSAPTSPWWAQFLGGTAFFGASGGLAYASHRARTLLMTPKELIEFKAQE